MRPLNFAILKYLTTVDEACPEDIIEALKGTYGTFRALNKKDILSALMTAEVNGLVQESRFELDENGELRIYYRAHEEGAATIKLPEGTQNGMIFRLRGKGVKALRSSDVGDMLVEVEVEIPSRLTKEQMDKLNAFASALDENRNQPACVEFADKAARYLKGK